MFRPLAGDVFHRVPTASDGNITVLHRFVERDRDRERCAATHSDAWAPPSIEGDSAQAPKEAPRRTGIYLPIVGQPVQGFSGISSLGGGEFLVLTDNGFGSRANSPDSLLMFHRVLARKIHQAAAGAT